MHRFRSTGMVAAATVAFGVGVAVVVPGTSGAVTRPTMDVDVTYVTDGHEVCAEGALQGADPLAGGLWTFTIAGARSDQSQVLVGDQASGSAYPRLCLTVWKNWTSSGAYTVEFLYAGVGDDLPWAAGGIGSWTTTDNQFIVDGG